MECRCVEEDSGVSYLFRLDEEYDVIIVVVMKNFYVHARIRGETASDLLVLAVSVMAKLISIDFEVFGRVQGVFFRKFTQKAAQELKIVGWCRNTSAGTVQGQLQGPSDAVLKMQDWLQHTGSPLSKVSSVKFANRIEIDQCNLKSFEIRH
ncbi:Acylphosphatase-like domain [Trinorchestia longiramus]|nr:Acylphosphatase-like domain [Trinorchestia longiramus]